jgi:hypothetical protein
MWLGVCGWVTDLVFINYFADAFGDRALPFRSDDNSTYPFSRGRLTGIPYSLSLCWLIFDACKQECYIPWCNVSFNLR